MQATVERPRTAGKHSHPIAQAENEPRIVIGGRYRLIVPLGTGSSGTVWLAQDERLRRMVAVKKLPYIRSARHDVGLHEACAAAQVLHLGTVTIHDVIIDDRARTNWLVMEVLPGRDLATKLRTVRRIDVTEVRYIAAHMLAALGSVHEAGLVHRDVKPANIQLCDDGRIVLIDFGLATSPCTTGGAETGGLVGSLPYLAPETVEEGRYSAASDLYALGVTLHAAITGRPADAPTYDLVRGFQTTADFDLSQPLVHPLKALLTGLLARDPAERSSVRLAQRHLT